MTWRIQDRNNSRPASRQFHRQITDKLPTLDDSMGVPPPHTLCRRPPSRSYLVQCVAMLLDGCESPPYVENATATFNQFTRSVSLTCIKGHRFPSGQPRLWNDQSCVEWDVKPYTPHPTGPLYQRTSFSHWSTSSLKWLMMCRVGRLTLHTPTPLVHSIKGHRFPTGQQSLTAYCNQDGSWQVIEHCQGIYM